MRCSSMSSSGWPSDFIAHSQTITLFWVERDSRRVATHENFSWNIGFDSLGRRDSGIGGIFFAVERKFGFVARLNASASYPNSQIMPTVGLRIKNPNRLLSHANFREHRVGRFFWNEDQYRTSAASAPGRADQINQYLLSVVIVKMRNCCDVFGRANVAEVRSLSEILQKFLQCRVLRGGG